MTPKHFVRWRTRVWWWFKYFRVRTAQNYLLRRAAKNLESGSCTLDRTTITTDQGIALTIEARRVDDDG